MHKQRSVYIIQHIFDHFYFKSLNLDFDNVEMWIIPHEYLKDKINLIQEYWEMQKFKVIIWRAKLAYVNTLKINKIRKTKHELKKYINLFDEIHIVDKSSIFSQLILDLYTNVRLHQYNITDNKNSIEQSVDYFKTIYQILLTIFVGFKPRTIKIVNSGKRKFYEYPTVGKDFSIKYIYFEKKIPKVNKKKIAVIYGSRFMQWGLAEKEIKKLSKKIKAVNNIKYKEIYYIPHPLETDAEYKFYSKLLKRIELIEYPIISAEDWTVNYSVDVIDTYSIGSTASKTVDALGYRSYVFYQTTLMCEDTKILYDNLFNESSVIHV